MLTCRFREFVIKSINLMVVTGGGYDQNSLNCRRLGELLLLAKYCAFFIRVLLDDFKVLKVARSSALFEQWNRNRERTGRLGELIPNFPRIRYMAGYLKDMTGYLSSRISGYRKTPKEDRYEHGKYTKIDMKGRQFGGIIRTIRETGPKELTGTTRIRCLTSVRTQPVSG